MEISQNFVAFSEYMNFNKIPFCRIELALGCVYLHQQKDGTFLENTVCTYSKSEINQRIIMDEKCSTN